MVRILADDWHVLTGSYVLDALPDFERAEFERHLQHCPSCGAEVRGLRETAARLAMARAVQPPPGMEQRVLAGAVAGPVGAPAGPATRDPVWDGRPSGVRRPAAVCPPAPTKDCG